MNLRMGSHEFTDVEIPLLWGSRAIIQDRQGRLSVVDLAGQNPSLEILGDRPAPEVEFTPTVDGFVISGRGVQLYSYHSDQKRLESIGLDLPDCTISQDGILIGTNFLSSNMIEGSPIGIVVDNRGIGIGAPMPPGLARLVV